MNLKKMYWFVYAIIIISMLQTVILPEQALAAQTPIMNQTRATSEQMIKYFQNNGGVYPYSSGDSVNTIDAFANTVIREANIEGVRGDVAFAQMMKETNFLKFTGTVQVGQKNFAGLGATGGGVQGATFPDVTTGIRSVIQHLKAYASTLPLNQACVDPRYNLVSKGCAPYVEWLGKADNPNGVGWAVPGAGYGYDIVNRVNVIISIPITVAPSPPPAANNNSASTPASIPSPTAIPSSRGLTKPTTEPTVTQANVPAPVDDTVTNEPVKLPQISAPVQDSNKTTIHTLMEKVGAQIITVANKIFQSQKESSPANAYMLIISFRSLMTLFFV